MQMIIDIVDKRINDKLNKTDGSGSNRFRSGIVVKVNDDNTANVLLTGASSPITNVPNRSCMTLSIGMRVYVELINGNLSNCVVKYILGTDAESNRIGYKNCYISFDKGLNCVRYDGSTISMNNDVGLEVDNPLGVKVAGLTLDGSFVSTRLGTPGAAEDQFFAIVGDDNRSADGYGFFLFNKGANVLPFFKIWSDSNDNSVIEYNGNLFFKCTNSNLYPVKICDQGISLQNNNNYSHTIGTASTGELSIDQHPTITKTVTLASGETLSFYNGMLADITPVPTNITRAIDISHYDTVTDWSSVKANTDAVYIKATQSTTFTDPEYQNFASGAAGVGLKYSFYHYLIPSSDVSQGTAQADYFYNAIKNISYNCIPALDCEETNGQSKDVISQNITNFCTEFKSLSGHDVMIYCSPAFAESYFTSAIGTYPLWIANWGVSSPTIPSMFNNYLMWQYTNTGSISGISGNVDMDKINGTILL